MNKIFFHGHYWSWVCGGIQQWDGDNAVETLVLIVCLSSLLRVDGDVWDKGRFHLESNEPNHWEQSWLQRNHISRDAKGFTNET